MSEPAGKVDLMRLLVIAASLVVVVAGMRAAESILVPFLLAVFIAVITAPLFLGLRRWGVPSGVALFLMILMLAVVGLLAAGVVRASISGLAANLPKYQTRLQGQTDLVWKWLAAKGIDPPDRIVAEALSPQVAMRYLGGLAGALSGMLTQTFLILLVVAFILLEVTILPAKVEALPGLSGATKASLGQIVEDVRRYMSLKTLTSLMTGVLVAILAALLGVDFPILLGLLAFMLNYVPNVGSFIAAIPGVLLAFIEFGPGWAAIMVLGYVAINVAVGNVIEPRLMGRGLGLSPLVVLISMIFWGWVLGPVGMLLSVPLTMIAKIALESVNETRWIALLMGSQSP